MEQSIGDATVVVLKYNMASGQWAELGSESGTCNISLLKSPSNEYRFVAWKLSNNEVVLNSFLFGTMNYNSTTPTFHQWYDEMKSAFGLNFTDPNEAKKFAIAVGIALETLNEIKIMKPAGDSLKTAKKIMESGLAIGSLNRQTSLARSNSSSKSNQPAAYYNVSAAQNISPTNNSSTKKETVLSVTKPDAGAPPPPGPPPAAPPPPGLPPSAPTVSVNKATPANDFASQLRAASDNMKNSSTTANVSNKSPEIAGPVKTNPTGFNAGPMDFLSELKMKSQKRTSESVNQSKKNETPKAPSVSAVNTYAKPITNQSSKLSASNSDLSTSYVTTADLDKFRVELMQDILVNMEKMKNEIISNILAKLN